MTEPTRKGAASRGTRREDLPEEATEEPTIRSPEEDAERATRRLEASEELQGADEATSLAARDNPLRTPGELSQKPREQAQRERRSARGKGQGARGRASAAGRTGGPPAEGPKSAE
jgi:hypothetical protein